MLSASRSNTYHNKNILRDGKGAERIRRCAWRKQLEGGRNASDLMASWFNSPPYRIYPPFFFLSFGSKLVEGMMMEQEICGGSSHATLA
jgi:hypothetical protein